MAVLILVINRPPNQSERDDSRLFNLLGNFCLQKFAIYCGLLWPNINFVANISQKEGERLLDFLNDSSLFQHIRQTMLLNNIVGFLIPNEESLI